MGNRGVIHNDRQEIVRPYRLIPWITCVLTFKDRHREVMTPGRWTELFFLDEATAFSAGHRPCKECRREDHLRFKRCWIEGNPGYGYNGKTKIGEIDAIIHEERMNKDKTKRVYAAKIDQLPDGVFVVWKDEPFLVKGDKVYPWKPEGYEEGIDRPRGMKVTVLTPKSIVYTFKAGYVPHMTNAHR